VAGSAIPVPQAARHGVRMGEPRFEFEKLDVYQLALRLMPLVADITSQLPVGYADLRNHVCRSERSIRLNVAEGAGSTGLAAKQSASGPRAVRQRMRGGTRRDPEARPERASSDPRGPGPLSPHHRHVDEAGASLGEQEGTLTVTDWRARGPAFPNSRTPITPDGHGRGRNLALTVTVWRVLYLRTGGAGRVGLDLGFSAMRRSTSWTARSSCGSRPWITAMGSCSTSMSGSTP
jgi:hypothetical protein